ncbi:tetratricopeptide repeat protein [Acaryochloris sp. 'Moss Beach']|uniref:tetratricopeptide repeat-containing S1 family peptidase n=1 Tax=Acaryochloris sp. 'Moss Beach' TaxID=2740837 RepID=UPI001F3F1B7E|nr:serine protease [Acaryochloris sp. 'Moss Beach']UJB70880.1 tetratricopeptide repeat protein [Acaryochloris sp. 'Moss Beach']
MVFKNFTYPTVALIGVAAVAIAPQPAQSLSPDQISGIAKQVTVLIDGQNPGSGVIINRDGDTYTVLTAFHVVGTPDEYDVVTPTDQRYKLDYQTVKRLPGIDLAVLKFKSDKTYKVADLGNSTQIQEGKPIFVAGFPQPTQAINLSIYRFTEGRLTANSSKPLADGYALVYNNSTRPGMSGGPVLDDQGALVGIHGRSDAQQQGNVYFKNDTNLGIPIDTFSTMVPQIGVKLDSNLATSPPSPSNPSIPPRPPVPQGPRAGDFYLQATDKLQRGDSQGALQDLNQAISLNPSYASAYGDRATIKFQQGDRPGALADLDQAIQIDPQLADAYGIRGLYRVVTGNIRGAQSDVEKAVRLKPEIGYASRGVVRWYRSDLSGAQSDFDQALNLKASFKDAYAVHYFRGFVRWQLGNYDGALKDLNRSIQLNPKYLEAVGVRGILRFQMGDNQGALRDFDEGIRINTGSSDIYTIRGMIRLTQGDNPGAISDFDQVIRIKPGNVALADMYGSRGIAYFQAGNDEQALASLQQAVQLAKDPSSRDSYQKLSNAINQVQSQPALRPKMKAFIQTFMQSYLKRYIGQYVQSYRPLQS